MENLWKKDESKATLDYVDIFAIVKSSFKNRFDEWDQYLHDLELIAQRRYDKSNEISMKLLAEGHDRLLELNYHGALEKYNQSLRFAEIGTESEKVAYEYRAECFVKLESHTKALFDIELALKLKPSIRSQMKLQTLRAKCQKILISTPAGPDAYLPKLTFPADKDFPCIADILEIHENKEFGRHVVATSDIEVGNVVMVNSIFAFGTVSDTQTCCSVCNKMEKNFIACASCPNAMFCGGPCSNRTAIHRFECKSIFHALGDASLKLPIQTLLMAIEMFPQINDLINFVEKCIADKCFPKSARDATARYGIFLKLLQYFDEEQIYFAYQVYTAILSIPKVNVLFDTNRKKLFLMHLTLHHLTVIPQNSFRQERYNVGWIKTDYIYDVLSLINHSCAPNLFNHSNSHGTAYCMTVRPIKKGEQLYINYLGNEAENPKEQRQTALDTWSFKCKCVRCEPKHVVDITAAREYNELRLKMKSDSGFGFIRLHCHKENCEAENFACGNRKKLKNECKIFLQKFAHSIWSPEISFVTHCFALH